MPSWTLALLLPVRWPNTRPWTSGRVLSTSRSHWIIPSGDAASLHLARQFQVELGAFGFQGGRYAGVGEHDDTVIAAWLAERAIQALEDFFRDQRSREIVTMEELGIERVQIGDDY